MMTFRWWGAVLFLVSGLLYARTPLVDIATVAASPEQSVLNLVGELRPMRRSVLSAETAGEVAQIFAERGDKVDADAVLTTIREQPAQFALRAAQGRVAEAAAGVERAVLNERRIGRLLQRQASSQDEYDSVQVELNKARAILSIRRAELDLAADQLTRHRVRAPFAGIVVERMIEQGQWLDVGDPCYTVEDIARLRAVFVVPQQYFETIQLDSEVRLSFEAIPGEQFLASITRILPQIKRQGRSFEIWVDLDNSDQRMVSGFSARGAVMMGVGGDDVVLVPRDAVLRARDEKAWLWRAADPTVTPGAGRAGSTKKVSGGGDSAKTEVLEVQQVHVEVVAAVGEKLMVRGDDLDIGMQVVVGGNETLKEGQSVRGRVGN